MNQALDLSRIGADHCMADAAKTEAPQENPVRSRSADRTPC